MQVQTGLKGAAEVGEVDQNQVALVHYSCNLEGLEKADAHSGMMPAQLCIFDWYVAQMLDWFCKKAAINKLQPRTMCPFTILG